MVLQDIYHYVIFLYHRTFPYTSQLLANIHINQIVKVKLLSREKEVVRDCLPYGDQSLVRCWILNIKMTVTASYPMYN